MGLSAEGIEGGVLKKTSFWEASQSRFCTPSETVCEYFEGCLQIALRLIQALSGFFSYFNSVQKTCEFEENM